ncbi:uncharacterized protein LOC129960716 isoform X2 [Argiope bruennichi]|uniref:uncharacterized protein LOC129960716 isoform X2 n=1 Tax=Argiope bruennichi TaxID=94029 RepID=UPI0024947CB9|nr:uncharacterized protein LOC129960716 isoform X2 [Argiope bruennichi]
MKKECKLPVSKRLNSLLLYTGGLVSAGGLGWCVRLAYAEQPKTAMAAALVGSAGAFLFSMVLHVNNRTRKNYFIRYAPNWWLVLPGGILFPVGFGYCLILGVKEHRKSSIIAFAVGSLSYTLVNAAIFDVPMSRNSEDAEDLKLSAEEVTSASFRFVSNVNRCEVCKAHVEKEFQERKN